MSNENRTFRMDNVTGGMNDIGHIYKVKYQLAKSVPELEAYWDEMDQKKWNSVMAEKRRIWTKSHDFMCGYDENKAKDIFWLLIKSSLNDIIKEPIKEELENMQFLKSVKDGNVYRIFFDFEKGEYVLEYFITDILYRDTYKLIKTKKGYILDLTKWMKFPIAIREFTFIADQAKTVMRRQWKNFKMNVEKGIISERSKS